MDTHRTLTSFAAILVLALATSASAKKSKNHKNFQGDWAIDLDAMIASDPKLAEAAKTQPDVMKELVSKLGSARFTMTADKMFATLGGETESASYKITKDGKNKLVIIATSDRDKEKEEITVTFVSRTTVVLSKPGDSDTIPLKRRPNNHKLFQGKWVIDVDEMIGMNAKLQADIKANPAIRDNVLKAMGKNHFQFTHNTLSFTFGDKTETATYIVRTDVGDKLVFESTDDKKEVEVLTATFKNMDLIVRSKEGDSDQIPLRRSK